MRNSARAILGRTFIVLGIALVALFLIVPLLLAAFSGPAAEGAVRAAQLPARDANEIGFPSGPESLRAPEFERPFPPITPRVLRVRSIGDAAERDSVELEIFAAGGQVLFGSGREEKEYQELVHGMINGANEVEGAIGKSTLEQGAKSELFPYRYIQLSPKIDAIPDELVRQNEDSLLEMAGWLALEYETPRKSGAARMAMAVTARTYEVTRSCDAAASMMSLYLASEHPRQAPDNLYNEIDAFLKQSLESCSTREDVKYLAVLLKHLRARESRHHNSLAVSGETSQLGTGILPNRDLWGTYDSQAPAVELEIINKELDNLSDARLSRPWRERLRGDLLLEHAILYRKSPFTARHLASEAARAYGQALAGINTSTMRLVYAYALVMSGERQNAAQAMRGVTPENLPSDQHAMAFYVLTQTSARDDEVRAFASHSERESIAGIDELKATRLGFARQDCLPSSFALSTNLSVSGSGKYLITDSLDLVGPTECGGGGALAYQAWLPPSRYFHVWNTVPHALTQGEIAAALSGEPQNESLVIQLDWLRVRGRTVEAHTLLEKALESKESDERAYDIQLMRAETMLLDNNPVEARRIFESVGFSVKTEEEISREKLEEEEEREAQEEGDFRWPGYYRRLADAQLQFAWSLKLTGDHDGARVVFSRAVRPKLAAIELGLMDMERGDREAALRTFVAAIDRVEVSKFPMEAIALHQNAAIAAYGLGKIGEARDYAMKALELDPWNSFGAEVFADSIRSFERPDSEIVQDAAIPAYRRVLELNSGHFSAWNNLGVMEVFNGNYLAAEQAFIAAIRVRCPKLWVSLTIEEQELIRSPQSGKVPDSLERDSEVCSFPSAWHNLGILWGRDPSLAGFLRSQGALGISEIQDSNLKDAKREWRFDEEPYFPGVDLMHLDSANPRIIGLHPYAIRIGVVMFLILFAFDLFCILGSEWLVDISGESIPILSDEYVALKQNGLFLLATVFSVIGVLGAFRLSWSAELAPVVIFCLGWSLLSVVFFRSSRSSTQATLELRGLASTGTGILLGSPFAWGPRLKYAQDAPRWWLPGTVGFCLFYVSVGIAISSRVPYMSNCVDVAAAWCAALFSPPTGLQNAGVRKAGRKLFSCFGLFVCVLGVLEWY